jgi:hypothetical protein
MHGGAWRCAQAQQPMRLAAGWSSQGASAELTGALAGILEPGPWRHLAGCARLGAGCAMWAHACQAGVLTGRVGMVA